MALLPVLTAMLDQQTRCLLESLPALVTLLVLCPHVDIVMILQTYRPADPAVCFQLCMTRDLPFIHISIRCNLHERQGDVLFEDAQTLVFQALLTACISDIPWCTPFYLLTSTIVDDIRTTTVFETFNRRIRIKSCAYGVLCGYIIQYAATGCTV